MRYILLVCAAVVFLLGIDQMWNAHFARANESGYNVGSKDAPGQVRSPHPTGNSKQGEQWYEASCVVCHGPRAKGGIGPRLAGNPVLSNDKAFWKIVHEGKHVMPPLKGVLTDQQIADIRAWLQTLR